MRTDPAFTIRHATPEDAQGIATMHVAAWVHAYRGIIPEASLLAQTVERRVTQWRDMLAAVQSDPEGQAVFAGADDAGVVQGFVHCGREREQDAPFDSEVYAIYLHPTVWRQGLGSRLFGHAADWLAAREHRTLRLWVLEQNPARAFYERLGGRLLPHRNEVTFGSVRLQHWCYGWNDVVGLAGRLPR